MSLWSDELGWAPRVVAYGHWGRPVVVFPPQEGNADDWERFGVVDAIRPLLDAGRVKVYCVDSWDGGSWFRTELPLEERARLHERYERWVTDIAVPWMAADSDGSVSDAILTGCDFGAYHAVQLALRRTDLFPVAIGMSGVYDLRGVGWGDTGEAFHYANPADSVEGLVDGPHLDWLRSRLSLLLLAGQGEWEDATGALASTRHLADLARARGLRVELDVWGHDVPHDWPSWAAMIAHHLPRFC